MLARDAAEADADEKRLCSLMKIHLYATRFHKQKHMHLIK